MRAFRVPLIDFTDSESHTDFTISKPSSNHSFILLPLNPHHILHILFSLTIKLSLINFTHLLFYIDKNFEPKSNFDLSDYSDFKDQPKVNKKSNSTISYNLSSSFESPKSSPVLDFSDSKNQNTSPNDFNPFTHKYKPTPNTITKPLEKKYPNFLSGKAQTIIKHRNISSVTHKTNLSKYISQSPSSDSDSDLPEIDFIHKKKRFEKRRKNKTPNSLCLKPFINQVGGHTPFLKFSYNAICKPLNPQENRFYNMVDFLHPNLHKFLPEYLGHVNVTYRNNAHTGDIIPEVIFEKNKHIMPKYFPNYLKSKKPFSNKNYLAFTKKNKDNHKAESSPGIGDSFKLNHNKRWKHLQEVILKEALTTHALKQRQKLDDDSESISARRRHSSAGIHSFLSLKNNSTNPGSIGKSRPLFNEDKMNLNKLDLKKFMPQSRITQKSPNTYSNNNDTNIPTNEKSANFSIGPSNKYNLSESEFISDSEVTNNSENFLLNKNPQISKLNQKDQKLNMQNTATKGKP
ncbi:putative inositol polyphosphate kinase [Smittium culicis]|uniref:Kinase n=1 Tax=Smittium culicis TaxID=133412 RepID=A0A1R1YPZ4_9FUNG|nr:putative inositol polyphosphate kinase [Smittium culicis]